MSFKLYAVKSGKVVAGGTSCLKLMLCRGKICCGCCSENETCLRWEGGECTALTVCNQVSASQTHYHVEYEKQKSDSLCTTSPSVKRTKFSLADDYYH